MPWCPPHARRRAADVGPARRRSRPRHLPRPLRPAQRLFPPHPHGGEEFLVLDGVFSDEHGDYPAGTYIRNPPTSAHTPSSAGGCTIFVKLWQFDPADRTPVVVHIDGPAGGAKAAAATAAEAGVTATPLFADAREAVSVEAWVPGAAVGRPLPGGAEVLVLAGTLAEGGETLRAHSWLRLPPGGRLDAVAGPGGARVWVKTGHLLFVAPPVVG
eukprot:TRINITY_DN7039_c0_g1_i1.p3 TRINITY_DN7039_c0_g1~~TRINITY_DN7039_c0_g1_i1.p3  ORF type:complete len:214 (+),score=59.04 TRINITY_DN7039_c0_g1_i1:895-1536(+)